MEGGEMLFLLHSSRLLSLLILNHYPQIFLLPFRIVSLLKHTSLWRRSLSGDTPLLSLSPVLRPSEGLDLDRHGMSAAPSPLSLSMETPFYIHGCTGSDFMDCRWPVILLCFNMFCRHRSCWRHYPKVSSSNVVWVPFRKGALNSEYVFPNLKCYQNRLWHLLFLVCFEAWWTFFLLLLYTKNCVKIYFCDPQKGLEENE